MTIVWRENLTYDIDIDPAKDITNFRMDWTDWLEEIDASSTISQVSFNPAVGLVVPTNQIDPAGKYVDFSVKVDIANLPSLNDLLKLEVVITSGTNVKPKSIYFKVRDL